MKDLAKTLWIAFDKKQPDYPEFINYFGKGNNLQITDVVYRSYESFRIIENFNTFLQKTLTIEMLVAIKDGEPMKKPLMRDEDHGDEAKMNLYYQYQQAMEHVLYEPFGQRIMNTAMFERYNRNVAKISEMNKAEITLNWWKEVLK